MGFGKRRNHKNFSNKNNNRNFKKKIRLKTKIRIIGVFVIAIGFLIGIYDDSKKQDLAVHQQLFLISIGLILAGIGMTLQGKLLQGLKNMSKERCNCCMCTNCNRSHNHWTHPRKED